MKRILNKLGYRLAVVTGWRWMMFVAGVSMLAGTQSCKVTPHRCYEAVPVDTTEAVQPSCYDMPAPVAPAEDINVTTPDFNNVQ